MNWFGRYNKEAPLRLNFGSRQDAFSYMIQYLVEEKKMEPMEAAIKANEFADIFAKNMGLPLCIEPEKQGIDKYLDMAQKISGYVEKNPKLVEYAVPTFTFLVGLVTGKKTEDIVVNNIPVQPEQEPIKFEELT